MSNFKLLERANRVILQGSTYGSESDLRAILRECVAELERLSARLPRCPIGHLAERLGPSELWCALCARTYTPANHPEFPLL